MTRAIDADKALKIFKKWIDTKQVEGEELRAVETCIAVIEDMPTLTPPNEPLTCKGCVYHEQDTGPCTYCARMQHEVDYYWPKEGGEEV